MSVAIAYRNRLTHVLCFVSFRRISLIKINQSSVNWKQNDQDNTKIPESSESSQTHRTFNSRASTQRILMVFSNLRRFKVEHHVSLLLWCVIDKTEVEILSHCHQQDKRKRGIRQMHNIYNTFMLNSFISCRRYFSSKTQQIYAQFINYLLFCLLCKISGCRIRSVSRTI